MAIAPCVDLVVNCYERTYRWVLEPGFFAGLEDENRFPFAARVALVNNVEDREDVRRRAQSLVESGELSAFHFVANELPAALGRVGMTTEDLRPIPHYSDCLLVAVTLAGSPWLVYWDADVRLHEPADWVTPAVRLIESDPRVFTANPDNWHHPAAGRGLEERDGFALGLGFSDQLFLARRADFARPIYGRRCVATMRNPLAHVRPIFEMWVDAHIRHNRLLRASHLGSHYVHPPETAGQSHPRNLTLVQHLRRSRNLAVLAYLRGAPRQLVPRCSRDLGGGV